MDVEIYRAVPPLHSVPGNRLYGLSILMYFLFQIFDVWLFVIEYLAHQYCHIQHEQVLEPLIYQALQPLLYRLNAISHHTRQSVFRSECPNIRVYLIITLSFLPFCFTFCLTKVIFLSDLHYLCSRKLPQKNFLLILIYNKK